jgi:hypothetical protein
MADKNKKSTAESLFDEMRQSFIKSADPETVERLRKLGEKFHNSLDIREKFDPNVYNMEEALAYVVESLKSGLHPSKLTEDEKVLLTAGYGEEWYKKWGYDKADTFHDPT